ncbi:hypothetical protein DUNSADRAFT_11227 [Dunaliella salina]|uniref:Uncharacterized protein n=1 Tax=Dunaliella salina TaxID=3046 RepID=A0ABQ7GDT7_DUNSA|nr:hypothetical protein DUNSADRAFT_11227 [Dunaliella salina]|eukprot:KAF5832769.1 hypothetical protein DUNSADRAFT_11227 [Dunaliella salina]
MTQLCHKAFQSSAVTSCLESMQAPCRGVSSPEPHLSFARRSILFCFVPDAHFSDDTWIGFVWMLIL